MKKMTQQLGREEQAMLEVGNTSIKPVTVRLMIAAFLLIIGFVPLFQQIIEIRAFKRGERTDAWPQCYDFARRAPALFTQLFHNDEPFIRGIIKANREILREMRDFENAIDDDSAFGKLVRPSAQYILARWLGAGNERAYCGRGDWLFYQPDVDYLTGRGFMEKTWLATRVGSVDEWTTPPQPNPVKAIIQFHKQLSERGITLIVMPVPVKTSVHPEKFARIYEKRKAPLQNMSHDNFIQALEQEGILVFDCAVELTEAARANEDEVIPQYLRADTHWRPEAVERIAASLKDFIFERIKLPDVPDPQYVIRSETASQTGDLTVMLKMPEQEQFYAPESVNIRRVLTRDNDSWRPDTTADVLVLGDSFSNIYSQEGLGWGESAGLIEQLSFELKRPLDRIAQNDNASYATRATLARELSRGRDRLAGKRVVIYQFAARELAIGDWKMLDLSLGSIEPASFIVPEAGNELIVQGVIKSVSFVPRPGTVPYRDHVMAIHLVDIENDIIRNGQALVYMHSMTNNIWTKAARYRVDDIINLVLRPWSDVTDKYEGINRSEPEDEFLLFQEPCWGEGLQ